MSGGSHHAGRKGCRRSTSRANQSSCYPEAGRLKFVYYGPRRLARRGVKYSENETSAEGGRGEEAAVSHENPIFTRDFYTHKLSSLFVLWVCTYIYVAIYTNMRTPAHTHTHTHILFPIVSAFALPNPLDIYSGRPPKEIAAISSIEKRS